MRIIKLTLPMFGFIVATRAALAAGIGLLVGNRLTSQQRRRVGLALITIGAATTVPAAQMLSHGIRRRPSRLGPSTDPRLIGATRHPRKGDDLF